jgi:hypothetical protein
MAFDIKALREQMANSDYGQVLNDIEEKLSGGKQEKDERMWYPERDKAGNGEGTIRFLPQKQGEKSPIVTEFSHSFKVNGKWLIEKCPTTIFQQCPVCENNSALWNSGMDSDRVIVSGSGKDNPGRKRKVRYYANILVIDDPANPENNGQIKILAFSKPVYNIVQERLAPKSKAKKPVNVFDLFDAPNFLFSVGKKDGYAWYGDSGFLDDRTPVADSDDGIMKIYNDVYALAEFVNPEKIKSYNELEARQAKILNTVSVKSKKAEDVNIPEPSKPEIAKEVGMAPELQELTDLIDDDEVAF